MPDSKITALTSISTSTDPANDPLVIVDVSDTSMAATGTTKKVTLNQLLGASGTATLASATITGDLTVDTSTLKVDSANNRVGIGTASPATPLDIKKTGAGSVTSILLSRTTGNVADTQGIVWKADDLALNYAGILGVLDGAATGSLLFQTATGGTLATKATLDSSGNLGLGVTPSASWVTYKAFEFDTGIVSGSSSMALNRNSYFDGVNWRYKVTTSFGVSQYQLSGNGNHIWNIAPSGTAGNAITFTQAMTLDASGRLLVGTTSTLIAADVRLHVEGSQGIVAKSTGGFAYYPFVAWNTATAGDNVFSAFGTEATYTARGSISYNRAGGLVAYNTTSDYRAKDIIGPVSNSGSLIDSLKVYVGKMKGATIERPMLIAHEAQEVAPYAVTGTKDEVDADGKPKYQQMDASALVPLLIAEIQSLRARVQTLETR